MAALVTQEEALRQLRVQAAAISAEELEDIMFKAEQASDIVVDYLKMPSADATPPVVRQTRRQVVGAAPLADPLPPEPWTETTTPPRAKAAILIMLTTLYDGRSPTDELLSEPIKSILHRLRDPAMA